MNRYRVVGVAALLTLLTVLPVLSGQPASGQTGGFHDLDYAELITSSVQLYTCDDLKVAAGDIDLTTFQSAHKGRGACWSGSGTVIRPDGTILTNSHVALDMNQEEPVWLLVRRTIDDRSLPQDAYFARAVLFSPAGPPRGFGNTDVHLDLAVLVPAFTLDGTPIQPGDLAMRPLPMGEEGSIGIGDELRNIGYPGIGGELITITGGAVSGFSPDPLVPDLGTTAWIKTDATLGGGISGGTTIDELGRLIGVPTRLGGVDDRGAGPIGLINHLRPVPEGYMLLTEVGNGDGLPEPSENGAAANSETDVVVTGTVVSADSGQPVPGAWFIVLKAGIPVADFLGGNQEAIHTFATTGADGAFQLKDAVTRGEAYGVVVIARGFVNMSEDGKVLAGAESPAVVTLPPVQMVAQR